MATDTTPRTIAQQAEVALVKLGEKAPAQAAVFVVAMTDAEQLAAASCHREGDKLRLLDLLDHVATRQHLEADLAAHASGVGGQSEITDDNTDLES